MSQKDSTNNKDKTPVLAAAADFREAADNTPITLSSGARAIIRPVSAPLIDSVISRIVDPEPPVVHDENKGRDYPNPDDPAYVRTLSENARLRGLAALDAMVMFGVELIDPVPDHLDEDGKPTGWYKKLLYMQKRELLNLSEYDFDDPEEREFVYKRFVAVAPRDIEMVNRRNRISPEVSRQVEDSF